MAKGRIFFLFAIALLTAEPRANAIEEIIKNYRGTRSLGLGGTLITTGEYSEALFGNPARHTIPESSGADWKISLIDITAEANTNLLLNYEANNKLRTANGNNLLTEAAKLVGKNEHVRTQALSAFYHPQIFWDFAVAAGMLYSNQTNFFIRHTTDLELQNIYDVGPALGVAYPFFNRHLHVGMNWRFLYRLAHDETIRKIDILGGSRKIHPKSPQGQQGFGIDGDVGLYYHIPWHPTFVSFNLGGSITNVLQSTYQTIPQKFYADPGTNPPHNDRMYNLGARFDFPDVLFLDSPFLAVEYLDFGATTKNLSWAKHWHIGGEFRFLKNYFAIRTGINQGYFTGGFGIYLPVLKIDFATYSEELGSNAGMTEDRRFVLRMAMEL